MCEETSKRNVPETADVCVNTSAWTNYDGFGGFLGLFFFIKLRHISIQLSFQVMDRKRIKPQQEKRKSIR